MIWISSLIFVLCTPSSQAGDRAPGAFDHDLALREALLAPSPLARPVSISMVRVSIGTAIVGGGATITGACLSALPYGLCSSGHRVGFAYTQRPNALIAVGPALMVAGGLIAFARLPEPKSHEAGTVDIAALQLRPKEYDNAHLSVNALYGGPCAIPGSGSWLLFPLVQPGTVVDGQCTVMSSIVGAMPRKDTAPLDHLALGEAVTVSGVLTRRHVMMGQRGQYSLEVEQISPLETP